MSLIKFDVLTPGGSSALFSCTPFTRVNAGVDFTISVQGQVWWGNIGILDNQSGPLLHAQLEQDVSHC